MTQYRMGMLVMNYLRKLGVAWVAILDAICDENLEQSYLLIKKNPHISKEEFLTTMGIEEYED